MSNPFDVVFPILLGEQSMQLEPILNTIKEIRVKAEEESDPSFGCRPSERSMETRILLGVVNIDKPPGPTSHEVVAWTRKILGVTRAGHSGTLEGFPRRSQCDRCTPDSS